MNRDKSNTDSLACSGDKMGPGLGETPIHIVHNILTLITLPTFD